MPGPDPRIKPAGESADRRAKAASLSPFRFAPSRSLLKFLVRANSSRSTLARLGSMFLLIAALSVFAIVGYLLPSMLAAVAKS